MEVQAKMKYIALQDSTKTVLVDDHDYERLNKFTWRLDNKGYARCGSRLGGRAAPYITIRLHHQVIGKPPLGHVVDHINRNKLDNRRENLRFVIPIESERNKDLQKNNTSGYRGVCFHKASGKFLAQIGYGKSRRHLGTFVTKEEAITAYNDAAERKYAAI